MKLRKHLASKLGHKTKNSRKNINDILISLEILKLIKFYYILNKYLMRSCQRLKKSGLIIFLIAINNNIHTMFFKIFYLF